MQVLLSALFLIHFCNLSQITAFDNNHTVSIRPSSNVKQFDVSTSDTPIVTWMEIKRGLYPNITSLDEDLMIGDNITILIYFVDQSYLHDLKVVECWAYDNENPTKVQNKVQLFSTITDVKAKFFGDWYQKSFPKSSLMKSLLYANLRAFKFPDKEQVFIRCDVQLCFKVCEKWNKKNIK